MGRGGYAGQHDIARASLRLTIEALECSVALGCIKCFQFNFSKASVEDLLVKRQRQTDRQKQKYCISWYSETHFEKNAPEGDTKEGLKAGLSSVMNSIFHSHSFAKTFSSFLERKLW